MMAISTVFMMARMLMVNLNLPIDVGVLGVG